MINRRRIDAALDALEAIDSAGSQTVDLLIWNALQGDDDQWAFPAGRKDIIVNRTAGRDQSCSLEEFTAKVDDAILLASFKRGLDMREVLVQALAQTAAPGPDLVEEDEFRSRLAQAICRVVLQSLLSAAEPA